MTRGSSLLARCALALSATLAVAPAAAQKDDAVVRARTLANEGGDLLDKKEYAEALDKVQQAERLYHAPTHLMMIADALENLGRLAEAADVYEKLTSEPLPNKAPPAFKRAQEEGGKRLRALLARVPSMLLELHGPAPDAATVTLDGKPFEVRPGVAVRTDPGEHQLHAEARGFLTRDHKFSLPEKGGVVKVDLFLAPEGTGPVDEEKPPEADRAAAPPSGGSSKVPAVVAFGIGAVGLGVGAVTGILSLGKVGELSDDCPQGKCSPAQQKTIDSAGTLGTISTVGFIAGGVGVAAGVVLLVALPGPKPTTGRATVQPTATFGGGGATLGVRGAF